MAKLVTVFGGSGFLGKHVVRALVKDGWRVRIPMRRPHTGQDLKVIGNVGQIQLMQSNLRYPLSVARAVDGSDAVINLTGILFETGKQTFESVHVRGAETIAKAVSEAGISNFVQMSAIGADLEAESAYSRSRARGEEAVRAVHAQADIIRASLIFGPEDSFFNRFASMARFAPALPLIGGGKTKFQPVYAGDVADIIATCVNKGSAERTLELGGPRVYTFEDLLRYVLEMIDRRRFLVPLPWFLARPLGFVGELSGMLPFLDPFLTRDQVADLKQDNVVNPDLDGFTKFGINPKSIEAIVPSYMERYRPSGQFHERDA